jgi:hypothetical protein
LDYHTPITTVNLLSRQDIELLTSVPIVLPQCEPTPSKIGDFHDSLRLFPIDPHNSRISRSADIEISRLQ